MKRLWPQGIALPILEAEPTFPVLSFIERLKFAEPLSVLGQVEVMRQTALFDRVLTRSHNKDTNVDSSITVAVFNMERGQTLPETLVFAQMHPMFKQFDVILANELDDACARSYNCDVSATFAQAQKMNDAFALEFIELVNPDDKKGLHGNSIFSRFPIKEAKVLRLPEKCNWYHDAKQKRIGGRLAILARLETSRGDVGVVSTHFENRTDASGRAEQMEYLLQAIADFFPDELPVILGGDFNTNGYDGRDYDAAARVLNRQKKGASLQSLYEEEKIFSLADRYGYQWREATEPEWPTRRAHFTEEIYDDKSQDTLLLHLDWLFSKQVDILDFGMISTQLCDHAAIGENEFLAQSRVQELSDHNIVWAKYRLP